MQFEKPVAGKCVLLTAVQNGGPGRSAIKSSRRIAVFESEFCGDDHPVTSRCECFTPMVKKLNRARNRDTS